MIQRCYGPNSFNKELNVNKQQRNAIAKCQKNLHSYGDEVQALIDTDRGSTAAVDQGTVDIAKTIAGKIEDLRSECEGFKDEEQEKYDNMPEGLQQAERGQQMGAAISAFDDADTAFNDAVTALESLKVGESWDDADRDLGQAVVELDSASDHLDTAAE